MIDPKKIEQIARQITASIPAGVREAADNVELKVKQEVESQLGNQDEVTHEDKDMQEEMVMRLRKRIEALEDRVDALDGKTVFERFNTFAQAHNKLLLNVHFFACDHIQQEL